MNNMDPSSASSPAAPGLDALLSHSCSKMRGSTERPASCCCGNLHCAYLEHNNAALEGLENQLENAARIGQVCHAYWESCLILHKQSSQGPCDLVHLNT